MRSLVTMLASSRMSTRMLIHVDYNCRGALTETHARADEVVLEVSPDGGEMLPDRYTQWLQDSSVADPTELKNLGGLDGPVTT